ncbi:MAG: hypothetical protein EOM21_20125 [Gammaproteobacteria bacterium]|nr:hypothetical protein [Gammaproteobacteria bacterium]
MGRPGITAQQVQEAAEALLAEGLHPTVVGVRTRLGGGSPNNITKWLSPHWSPWHSPTSPDWRIPLLG